MRHVSGMPSSNGAAAVIQPPAAAAMAAGCLSRKAEPPVVSVTGHVRSEEMSGAISRPDRAKEQLQSASDIRIGSAATTEVREPAKATTAATSHNREQEPLAVIAAGLVLSEAVPEAVCRPCDARKQMQRVSCVRRAGVETAKPGTQVDAATAAARRSRKQQPPASSQAGPALAEAAPAARSGGKGTGSTLTAVRRTKSVATSRLHDGVITSATTASQHVSPYGEGGCSAEPGPATSTLYTGSLTASLPRLRMGCRHRAVHGARAAFSPTRTEHVPAATGVAGPTAAVRPSATGQPADGKPAAAVPPLEAASAASVAAMLDGGTASRAVGSRSGEATAQPERHAANQQQQRQQQQQAALLLDRLRPVPSALQAAGPGTAGTVQALTPKPQKRINLCRICAVHRLESVASPAHTAVCCFASGCFCFWCTRLGWRNEDNGVARKRKRSSMAAPPSSTCGLSWRPKAGQPLRSEQALRPYGTARAAVTHCMLP